MTEKREVSIRVPVLARVEGEGALEIDIAGGRIADLKLRLAQLKAGSELGTDVSPSAEFINLLQHNLDTWENRKKTLAEPH